MRYAFFLIITLATLLACQSDVSNSFTNATTAPVAIRWAHLGNMQDGEHKFRTHWTLVNHGADTLPATGWTIYFNQLIGGLVVDSVQNIVQVQHLGGDYYQLQPDVNFTAIAPGDSMRFTIDFRGAIIKESHAPNGVYIVFNNPDGSEQKPQAIEDFTVLPFTGPEQINRSPDDQVPIPTPAWQYAENIAWAAGVPEVTRTIIPTPKQLRVGKEQVSVDKNWRIRHVVDLENEANYLAEVLETVFGTAPKSNVGNEASDETIFLNIDPALPEVEGYELNATPNGITISGKDAAGVFYGVQSLLAWLPVEAFRGGQEVVTFDAVHMADAPRFGYRGLHLDASRNFHRKETVLKLLDLMGFYKLNKLHFHLADDEGWRLEIPNLPELTDVGARRGHTQTELDMLHPSYGSGPFADPAISYGNGFYSKADFIEILRKATARHIEVIPEFDTPGHSRAAIKAMASRYQRLLDAGKPADAEKYLLHDPEDASVYNSAQNYDDNVMCVCRESVYTFWETVIDDVQAIYAEAQVPLTIIHIGGDEVPGGVWERSPICDKLKADHPNLKTTEDLAHYYLRRVNAMLLERGLYTGGWEEIAMKRENGRYVPNPEFSDKNLQAYVWINLWGNQDMANRLANAGFPVVLCNVTNLYFDLAYNKDPEEPGLYWGGFVDTRNPFAFVPEDIFKSTVVDNMGKPFDIEAFYRTMETLTPAGYENILGIQAQLWSETIKGQDMLEYYLLPKLLGLAERAWAQQPDWAKIDDEQARESALRRAWSHFAHHVGKRELPRLDHLFGGWHYRIPLPGAIIDNGMLRANVTYPGLQIRYTTDGSEPSVKSALFEKTVKVDGVVKLKAFDTRGRGSRTVEVR